MSLTINKILVCGAGTMGSGIAQVIATAGFDVLLYDVSTDMLASAKKRIEENIYTLVQKEKITEIHYQQTLQHIQYISSISNVVVDVAIEAIVEKLEVKLQLFQQIASFNSSKTILASNTSSLSIEQLASALPHPERVLGMHFFNPAPIMKLVEVVQCKHTNVDVVNAITNLSIALGKTPVLVNDAPGFIVNRVARHYYLEAMKFGEQGLDDIAPIDKLLETVGFKMGPFKLMDLIGMDINYAVSSIVWENLGKPKRLEPSIIQKNKVENKKILKQIPYKPNQLSIQNFDKRIFARRIDEEPENTSILQKIKSVFS